MGKKEKTAKIYKTSVLCVLCHSRLVGSYVPLLCCLASYFDYYRYLAVNLHWFTSAIQYAFIVCQKMLLKCLENNNKKTYFLITVLTSSIQLYSIRFRCTHSASLWSCVLTYITSDIGISIILCCSVVPWYSVWGERGGHWPCVNSYP